MRRVLKSVLDTDDLPLAELHAARLDGELYPVEGCFSPVDEIPSVRQRATAVFALAPRGGYAEGETAAWVHGARLFPPRRHTFCVDTEHRVGTVRSPEFTVRERRLHHDDLVRIGPLTLTAPLLTAVDIAREAVLDLHGVAIATLLLKDAGASVEDALRLLDGRAPLPGNRRARGRLRAWKELRRGEDALPAQPALTRYTS